MRSFERYQFSVVGPSGALDGVPWRVCSSANAFSTSLSECPPFPGVFFLFVGVFPSKEARWPASASCLACSCSLACAANSAAWPA